MVVNRRQPVVPMPPMSRTASSQPLPTKRPARSSHAKSSVPAPSALQDDQKSNGHIHTPSHRKTKSKPDKKWKSKTIIDLLSLFLLSAFTCYSFYLCRPNPLFSSPSSDSLLCRALVTYRTHVLEPYVLPPITQTLHYAHKVSQPYVEEAQVRLSPYFEPAKAAIDTLTPHVVSSIRTTKSIWKDTLVPFYTQTLWPYYEGAVVPRYIRYVKPLLVPLQNKVRRLFAYYVSNPIRSKTNFVLHKLHQFYILHIDPYVRFARPYAHRFSNMTHAASVNLSTTYTTYMHPTLLKLWDVGVSISGTAWKHYFRFFLRSSDIVCAYVKWVIREVGAYRRQYIDRHVDRILEQVAEPKVNGNIKDTNGSPSLVGETRALSRSAEPATSSPIAAASTSIAPFTATSNLGSSSSVDATNGPFPGSPEDNTSASISRHSEVETALSTAEESAHPASTVIHEPTTTPNTSADEVSSTNDPAATAEANLSSTPESDPDLDEFLRELGVGEQINPVPSFPEESQEDVVRPKTEEERLAETAAKRADIVGRQEKWFEMLHAGVKETGDGLVKTLQSLRDAAAEDVRRFGTRPSKVSSETGSSEVDKEVVKDARSLALVEQDGEKLIKGLEVYLRKAEGRCNDWKIGQDAPPEAKKSKQDTARTEKEKFLDIVSKVEGKFAARVDDVRLNVHKWYVDLKEREAGEVIRASSAIRDLATRAQEDIGMDYAWLDDVTYLDWQRYHDLMRVHDSFDITARQIVNGTSTDPTPPSDPVLEALNELDRDLQDIILGFNYALSRTRSNSLKIFNSRPLDSEDDDDDDDGFFVVRDNEKRIVDLRDVDLGKVELKKDSVGVLPIKQDDGVKDEQKNVGILPVPDVQVPENGDSGFDASRIIIGKDKVQIEEALKDIPLEPPAQRHTEL